MCLYRKKEEKRLVSPEVTYEQLDGRYWDAGGLVGGCVGRWVGMWVGELVGRWVGGWMRGREWRLRRVQSFPIAL